MREEVIKGWSSLKEKINQVKFSPQDKAVWKFLENSKTARFSIHALRSYNFSELEQLRKDIETERQSSLDDYENDLLCDYWMAWSNLNNLILDWISLKSTVGYYKEVIEKLLPESLSFDEIWKLLD